MADTFKLRDEASFIHQGQSLSLLAQRGSRVLQASPQAQAVVQAGSEIIHDTSSFASASEEVSWMISEKGQRKSLESISPMPYFIR